MTERLKFGTERQKQGQEHKAGAGINSCPCLLFVLLNIVSDGALEVGTVVTAQGELLAVLHDDAVLAVKPRLHLFDLVDLYDGRTMNASKLPGVELFFKTADSLA